MDSPQEQPAPLSPQSWELFDTRLTTEVESLHSEVNELRKEMREIRMLLRVRTTPLYSHIQIPNWSALGGTLAPTTSYYGFQNSTGEPSAPPETPVLPDDPLFSSELSNPPTPVQVSFGASFLRALGTIMGI